MSTTPDSHATVLAANQSFYDALEGRDMAAMSAAWEHSNDVVCVHPGWTILRGWTDIADSWDAILNGPGHNQFILTKTTVRVEGDTAWVVLDERWPTAAPARLPAPMCFAATAIPGSW